MYTFSHSKKYLWNPSKEKKKKENPILNIHKRSSIELYLVTRYNCIRINSPFIQRTIFTSNLLPISVWKIDRHARRILTFAGAESFAGDADRRVVDAIVVFQPAWGAVRAIIAPAKERRLNHGAFLTSGNKKCARR